MLRRRRSRSYLRCTWFWLYVRATLASLMFGSRALLQLIEHCGKCVLQIQGFLDFIGADVRILAVLQKTLALMLANELHESFGIGLPVHRKALEVLEDCAHARGAE